MVSGNEAAARTGMAGSGAEFIERFSEFTVSVDGATRVDLARVVGERGTAVFQIEVLERSYL